MGFPDDPAFDRAFNAAGDQAAVRRLLTPEVRKALVSRGWRGRLITTGDILAWRSRGLLWPDRADRTLADVEILRRIVSQE